MVPVMSAVNDQWANNPAMLNAGLRMLFGKVLNEPSQRTPLVCHADWSPYRELTLSEILKETEPNEPYKLITHSHPPSPEERNRRENIEAFYSHRSGKITLGGTDPVFWFRNLGARLRDTP